MLVDFIVDLTPKPKEEKPEKWNIVVNGSSNKDGRGASIMMKGPNNLKIEYTIHFNFKASNNEAKYEALLAGLRITKNVNLTKIEILTDS